MGISVSRTSWTPLSPKSRTLRNRRGASPIGGCVLSGIWVCGVPAVTSRTGRKGAEAPEL